MQLHTTKRHSHLSHLLPICFLFTPPLNHLSVHFQQSIPTVNLRRCLAHLLTHIGIIGTGCLLLAFFRDVSTIVIVATAVVPAAVEHAREIVGHVGVGIISAVSTACWFLRGVFSGIFSGIFRWLLGGLITATATATAISIPTAGRLLGGILGRLGSSIPIPTIGGFILRVTIITWRTNILHAIPLGTLLHIASHEIANFLLIHQ
mmetsp:Transcript_35819/g.65687  ORF Transcript_35819/g.65687 Transcript_35819/m.65687 type:complete len:205 (+) Transcript_35819:130-744(+)